MSSLPDLDAQAQADFGAFVGGHRLGQLKDATWFNQQVGETTFPKLHPVLCRVEMWRGGLGVGFVCFRYFRFPVP